jgi:isopentenyl phosphate kinase
MDKNLVLIKLGGSLVAPKEWEAERPDRLTIRKLSREIAHAYGEGYRMVISTGSGNFGHQAAAKYGIKKGFDIDNRQAKWGACMTQRIAAKINSIVVEEILRQAIPAAAVAPHDIFVTAGGELQSQCGEIVLTLLEEEIIPVLYGDVIWDKSRGCVIFSGETALEKITPTIIGAGWKIDRVVQAGKEDGVWNAAKKIIPEINFDNWTKVQAMIGGAEGMDVTGGMLHKVEESLQVAREYGIKTWIINGNKEGLLAAAIQGKSAEGTIIG